MDNDKMKDLANTCNIIQGLALGVNDQLRGCITDLGQKISVDNMGTRSNKNGAYHSLIDGFDVLQGVSDLNNSMMEALNKVIS